jgi:hypothetical protein
MGSALKDAQGIQVHGAHTLEEGPPQLVLLRKPQRARHAHSLHTLTREMCGGSREMNGDTQRDFDFNDQVLPAAMSLENFQLSSLKLTFELRIHVEKGNEWAN